PSQPSAAGSGRRLIAGIAASSADESSPPTRMKGRRRPSQPAQLRSDQAPKTGETSAPSNERVLPSRPINRYDVVIVESQSGSVKLLKAANTPRPKAQPR